MDQQIGYLFVVKRHGELAPDKWNNSLFQGLDTDPAVTWLMACGGRCHRSCTAGLYLRFYHYRIKT
jgi:hypothetical protein